MCRLICVFVVCLWHNIRIFHGGEARIENSLRRVTVWNHEALPNDTKLIPTDRILYPHRTLMLDSFSCIPFNFKWTASSEFGTYRLCEQRRFRRACASAQSRQNLRCSLIQAVSQEEPSDRKPDPWPPLNGWACAVRICHDRTLEDTNSLDGAQMFYFKSSIQ